MRLIVFGGKGGVGKSSISTATAVKIAELTPDKKVLLISFDVAHNLSDLLSIKIGNEITAVTENLWAVEPDAEKYTEEYTREFAEKMRTLVKGIPIVSKIPNLEEFIETTFTSKSIPLALKNAMFFQYLLDADEPIEEIGEDSENLLKKISFDYVIADFPPTGNMIALFEIPQNTIQVILKYTLNTMASAGEFMKKVRKVTKILRPFSWGKSKEEQKNLAKDILKSLKELENRGERITKLMKENGSLRLVTIAEKPSYEEIKRGKELTKQYMKLDAIHINQIINTKYNDCEMCKIQRDNQDIYIDLIQEEFSQVKIWTSHRLTRVPIAMAGLKNLADEVYGKDASLEKIIYPNQ